jgi:hypothetical protein
MASTEWKQRLHPLRSDGCLIHPSFMRRSIRSPPGDRVARLMPSAPSAAVIV